MSDIFKRLGAPPSHPYTADKFLFSFLRRPSDNWPKFNVNGSIIPQNFEYTCKTGYTTYIHDIIIMLSCTNMEWEKFGNLPRLTNGVLLKVINGDNSTLLDFLDGEALRNTRNFVWFDENLMYMNTLNPNDISTIKMKIPLHKIGCVLQLNPGQKIRLTVQDDLSQLNVAFGAVMGIKYYA